MNEGFGGRMRDCLAVAEKSQIELSQATGISQSTISRACRGHFPRPEDLLKISRYFNVSMPWLIEGETAADAERNIIKEDSIPYRAEKRLTEKGKREILKALEELNETTERIRKKFGIGEDDSKNAAS